MDRITPVLADSLVAVFSTYPVHVTASVISGASTTTNGDDLLASTATTVFRGTQYLPSHEIHGITVRQSVYVLDTGETHAIWLVNDLSAAMFVADDF